MRERAREIDELSTAGEADDELALEGMRLVWPAYFADPERAPPMPDLRIAGARSAEMVASIFEELPSLEAGLPGIRVPVGFVHGSRSPMPLAASTDAAERIPGAWVEVVDGAGHFTWVEAPGAVLASQRYDGSHRPRRPRAVGGGSGVGGVVAPSSPGRGRLVADGRDLAGRHRCPGPEERLEMRDVVRLDDEVRRVLRERQPVAVDLDVLRCPVEERRRAPFAVRAILGRVRLLDVEEHPEGLPVSWRPSRRLRSAERIAPLSVRACSQQRGGAASPRLSSTLMSGEVSCSRCSCRSRGTCSTSPS